MKVKNYIIASLFSVVSLGCTDLDPVTDYIVTQEKLMAEKRKDLIEDPSKIGDETAPAYTSLYQFMGERNIYALTEGSSDEMMTPTRGNDWGDNGLWVQLHQHTWQADHLIVENAWNDMSVGIARTFNTLNNIYEIADGDAYFLELAAPYISEVRFLRAYYVWQVIDLFGQVPYQDEEGNKQALDRVTATNLVIAELEEIIPLMFAKKEQPQYGKVVKETAQALLAKVYLNKFIYEGGTASTEDMDKVIALTNEVITSGSYQLEDDFFSLFDFMNQGNSEALLVVSNGYSIQHAMSGQTRALMTLHYFQTAGDAGLQPWNGMCTTADFYNKWDDDKDLSNGISTVDKRYQDDRYISDMGVHLGMLVGLQKDRFGNELRDRSGNPLTYTSEVSNLFNAAEYEGVRVLKWAPDLNSTDFWRANNEVALLRLADVYLMKVEALWRKGDNAQALAELNSFRAVRNAIPVSSIAADGQEILDERGFELYWEGYRRTDLIRFQQHAKGTWFGKETTSTDKNVFPIPTSVLAVSTEFVQNTGY